MQERKLALRAYLLWAFGIAWVLQITAGMLYRSGHLLAYSNQLLLGPLMVGLVGGLPMILLGFWLCSRGSAPALKEEDNK